MGNTQDKQQASGVVHVPDLTVNMCVVKNQEYEDTLRMILERMNTKQHCRLELLKSGECSWHITEYTYVVESWLAKLQTDKIHSEFHLLSFLSNTFCRQLSQMGISCWLKYHVQRRDRGNIQSKCEVDKISFGTMESVISFVTSSTPRSITTSAATYELEFQFHNKKICLTQQTEERLFSLEIENRHMHRIVYVVRRENRFDVYFQLRQPPLMYECLNPGDDKGKRRFSRRSYLHGMTSEEIGPCDVLRVSLSTSICDETLQEVLSNLPGADSPRWELRFAWITERTTNVTAVPETGLCNFAVLYANKVLQSVGLRCQLINCSQLLKGLPKKVHAQLLYHVAKLYENESEYYLIDIQKIIQKQIRNPNSNAYNDSRKVRTVILTPTRIIFRRPSAFESNRVFRKYFPGDLAEYVMKVDFRDEDVRGEAKNLHFIPLLSWKDHLDDQVSKLQWRQFESKMRIP